VHGTLDISLFTGRKDVIVMILTYILSGALGLLIGCFMGYLVSSIIVIKRNVQDIHNRVTPEAAGEREETNNDHTT